MICRPAITKCKRWFQKPVTKRTTPVPSRGKRRLSREEYDALPIASTCMYVSLYSRIVALAFHGLRDEGPADRLGLLGCPNTRLVKNPRTEK